MGIPGTPELQRRPHGDTSIVRFMPDSNQTEGDRMVGEGGILWSFVTNAFACNFYIWGT